MENKAYPFRGLLVDSGRYFIPVDDMLSILDEMAYLNMNVLHWHLTEDQGWRIEIKAYPLLTAIGSIRSHTNFNHKRHSGFYTQEDIKKVVSYAHGKGIKVMPEIDIPGHSVAAIAAYSHLSCFDRKLDVATHWGVKHDILCAGKDSTYEFYRTVFDEVCSLFDDNMIHLGGDEVPKTRWKLCPKCQYKIKELGLKDEDALQDWFMEYFADYLGGKGVTTYRWVNDEQEALRCKGSIPMFYGKYDKKLSMPHIDCSSDAYYFDLPYGYVPYNNTKNHVVGENAVGVECCLWGEYIPDWKTGKKKLYPRAYAFSQTAMGNKVLDSPIFDKPGKYNPSKLFAAFNKLWFEKRQLEWEGLTILLDNKKVAGQHSNDIKE